MFEDEEEGVERGFTFHDNRLGDEDD